MAISSTTSPGASPEKSPADSPANSEANSPAATAGSIPTRRRPVIWAVEHLRATMPDVGDRMSRLAVRGGYRLVNRSMRQLQRNCLNYGWAPADGGTVDAPIAAEQESDRYGLQLYFQVAGGEAVRDRDVLEIGCGRGAGSVFVARALGARSVTAVDLTASSIKWAREHWAGSNVTFRIGDAESLDLPDATYDVVMNVESSHNYPHPDRFLAEVFRVLRPGGVLRLADLRPTAEMTTFRDDITAAGLVIEEEEDITPNVVCALEADAAARRLWVETRFPRVMRRAAHEFAGGPGTSIHEALKQRSWEYHRFVARKPL